MARRKSSPELGHVQISDDVLAELAGHGALATYGVVGMANPNRKAGVAQLLTRDRMKKGVVVTRPDGALNVDLFVVLEYGTKLAEVAHNVSLQVKFEIEKYCEMEVDAVNVHVQSIKVHK